MATRRNLRAVGGGDDSDNGQPSQQFMGQQQGSSPAQQQSRPSGSQQNDPWHGEEDGYTIDEFYTGSKDGQGHSTWVRVRVADHIFAQAGVLIASGEVRAYRTIPDIFRDAIYHRIRYLSRALGTRQLSKLENLIAVQEGIEQQARVYEQIDEILDTASRTLQKMAKYDDRAEIDALIQRVRTGLERILTREEYARMQTRLDAIVRRILLDSDSP